MQFKCKNCGGNVVFAPDQGKMFCPHCDGTDSGEKDRSGTGTECANCGAPLSIGKYNSTCKCEYCGSYIILEDRVEGAYKPDLLLPFQVGKKQAVERLRSEFKSRIFTPDSFLTESTLEEMKGMYVPFWMYDYYSACKYVGKGTKVRVWSSGNTEYTETSYYRVERNMDIDFDKIPADASVEMPDDVMNLMEPYDYKKLEGFEEKYMSGFYGEIYNMGADEAEQRAKEKARRDAEALLQETLSGYTTLVPEHKEIDIKREAVHYSLLPVWRYIYSYQNKKYEFYLNGQTGKIIGSTPVSKKKVLAYGGTVFAALWMALTFLFGIIEIL